MKGEQNWNRLKREKGVVDSGKVEDIHPGREKKKEWFNSKRVWTKPVACVHNGGWKLFSV